MKNQNRICLSVVGMFLVSLAGCGGVQVVPEDLEDHVNHDISFSQLRENPLSFKAKVLVVGGKILSARRLKSGTQIEVLQLPLVRNMKPEESLQKSRGRFLAIQEEFLDPATLPFGTRVTVVGEVSDMVTLPLDETNYDFPTLVIKRLTVWPPIRTARVRQPYPYCGPVYYGPYWWW